MKTPAHVTLSTHVPISEFEHGSIIKDITHEAVQVTSTKRDVLEVITLEQKPSFICSPQSVEEFSSVQGICASSIGMNKH